MRERFPLFSLSISALSHNPYSRRGRSLRWSAKVSSFTVVFVQYSLRVSDRARGVALLSFSLLSSESLASRRATLSRDLIFYPRIAFLRDDELQAAAC